MTTKILGSVWFGSIGVVLVDTGHGQKAYIEQGFGNDQKEDEEYIARHGKPFPLKQAREMVGQ